MARALDLGPDPENLPPAPSKRTQRDPWADIRPRFSGYVNPIQAMAHALRDIEETLVLHRDRDIHDPYVAKLLREKDEVGAYYQHLTALRTRNMRGRA